MHLQLLALTDNPAFRNALVAMRLKATTSNLPSTYDAKVYLHNQFVKHIQMLKEDITVRKLPPHQHKVDMYLSRQLQGKFPSLQMVGRPTLQRRGSLV